MVLGGCATYNPVQNFNTSYDSGENAREINQEFARFDQEFARFDSEENATFKCFGDGELTIITAGAKAQRHRIKKDSAFLIVDHLKNEVSFMGTTSKYLDTENVIEFRKEFIISGEVTHKLDYKLDKETLRLTVNKTWPILVGNQDLALKDQIWMEGYTCIKSSGNFINPYGNF